jgi:hypothetical protein
MSMLHAAHTRVALREQVRQKSVSTSRSSAILEKLVAAQMAALYGTRRFVTVTTRAHHCSL